MTRQTILVINPNSNAAVTAGLRESLIAWEQHPAISIECVTLEQGPFGIESDEDIRSVEPLILEEITRRDDCAAFVIACYSDPGLDACRAHTRQPVLGMQQSAVATALALGGRFGVLALGEASIARHLLYLEKLGLSAHLAGERPLNLTVAESGSHPEALPRILQQGRDLVERTGARSLILGCAGMARHRAAAEDALGVPVIEPVQAAVSLAAGRLA